MRFTQVRAPTVRNREEGQSVKNTSLAAAVLFMLASAVCAAGEMTPPPAAGLVEMDDAAVFRAGSSLWAVRRVTRVYFGTDDDLPVSN